MIPRPTVLAPLLFLTGCTCWGPGQKCCPPFPAGPPASISLAPPATALHAPESASGSPRPLQGSSSDEEDGAEEQDEEQEDESGVVFVRMDDPKGIRVARAAAALLAKHGISAYVACGTGSCWTTVFSMDREKAVELLLEDAEIRPFVTPEEIVVGSDELRVLRSKNPEIAVLAHRLLVEHGIENTAETRHSWHEIWVEREHGTRALAVLRGDTRVRSFAAKSKYWRDKGLSDD